MIRHIQYPHQPSKAKDPQGKEINIIISPSQVLMGHGPMIQISITHPPQMAQHLQQKGIPNKAIQVNALLDTGATTSIITPDVAAALGLKQTGFKKITSVQDEQDRPVYFAMLVFPWGKSAIVSAAACPIKGIQCLIGRDVMRNWNLIYNGVSGCITICD